MKIELISKVVMLAAIAAVGSLRAESNEIKSEIETRQIICSRSADHRTGQDGEGDNH
jgi:hypothetical protein